MSAPQFGRNVYNAELTRIRLANATFQRCLSQLAEDPGQQTRLVLVTRMALALNESQDATNNLEKMGKQAKNLQPA